MTFTFRNIAFGAALGAGFLVCQHSFADDATPPAAPTPPAQNAGDHHRDVPRSADAGHQNPDAKPHRDAPKHDHDADKDKDTTAPDQPPPSTDQPPAEGAPLSTDELSKEYQKLSPETREALMKTLKEKGVDGLSSMSESDARTTFAGLPNNVKDQIQAKWDALSDEQRVAIKKMGPDGIKQLFASQMKQMVKQTVMDPVTKPVEAVVASTQAAVQKTTTVLQKSREYVQKWLSKLRGDAPPPEQQATQ